VKTIDVCLSPELMHLYSVEDKSVVVVDILRATSSMVTAFAHGINAIYPVANLDDCRAMKSKGYLIAGERDGEKVSDFDLGNSPFEYMAENLKGQQIAFTTTNGTQAIAKSIDAKEILIGAFLNLSAVAEHLIRSNRDILIVCAGWKGKVNLEDSVFAGALVEKLKNNFTLACDAPLAAQHLYNAAKTDMVEFLSESSHVKRLNKLNIHEDMEFCLTVDKYSIVPALNKGVLRVKA
jgi:2-phosphosulfolactate phosphatase